MVLRVGCGGRARKTQAEERPAAARSLHGHTTAVRLGAVLHDREAEARAGPLARVLGAPEAVEDACLVAGGDAGTVLAHRRPGSADGHLGPAAGRAPLPRVVQQVRDRTED